MKGGKGARGYTIVEVMMFLAITGVLFVVAMVAISGQQAKADFQQGVRDFQSRMDDFINDVPTGYFPQTDATCSSSAGGVPSITPANSGNQGTNSDCIFLGKVLHFTDDDSEVKVYSVVGNRLTTQGNEVDGFDNAKPTTSSVLTETYTTKGGVKPSDFKIDPTGTNYNAIGFFNKFAGSAGGGDSQASGLTVIPLSMDTGNFVNKIEAIDDTVAATQANKLVVCIKQSDSARAAWVLTPKATGAVSELIIGQAGSEGC